MVEALAAVATLRLPDAWIGAGVIRNAIWDAVSSAAVPRSPSDLDVVYFDRHDPVPERDRALEAALAAAHPSPSWSVKNQARMHVRAGDPPYASTADAVSRWPETCTAVAARLVCGRIEVLAPWGVADLLARVVRPTPAFAQRVDVIDERVRAKGWMKRWPGITVVRTAAPRRPPEAGAA